MKNRFLPLGSVVRVDQINYDIMIIGYAVKNEDDGKNYDYIGVIDPIGYYQKEMFLFNEDKINDIVFMGYQKDKYVEYREKIYKFAKDVKNDINVDQAIKELLESLKSE